MSAMHSWAGSAAVLSLIAATATAEPQLRTEHFDTDPGWDAHNNRMVEEPGRETVQDFGFSESGFAGGDPGEIGGSLQTAAERAYYAKQLAPVLSLDTPLSASGTLAFAPGRATGPFLIGFFDAKTSFGWRTPNTLSLRIDGRGEVLHVHMEYCTASWRAGAGVIGAVDPDNGRLQPVEFPANGVHRWSFTYQPASADRPAHATFEFDGYRGEMDVNVVPGDGATFDRFGMFNVMKSSDNRLEVYLDNATINGVEERFDRDPAWDAEGNRNTYRARIVRPWFDFGYSATNFAGRDAGEIGGTVFRGDHRFDNTKAYYGDRTGELSLAAPLEASGRVSLLRSISDAGVLIGWFHSAHSFEGGTDKSTIPQDFVGAFIEGPSSEGFYFRPVYRIHGEESGVGRGPYIFPDRVGRDWAIQYSPDPPRVTVLLDGESASINLTAEPAGFGATFNRFGIITTQIDGNYEIVYFDDLTYTVEQ